MTLSPSIDGISGLLFASVAILRESIEPIAGGVASAPGLAGKVAGRPGWVRIAWRHQEGGEKVGGGGCSDALSLGSLNRSRYILRFVGHVYP